MWQMQNTAGLLCASVAFVGFGIPILHSEEQQFGYEIRTGVLGDIKDVTISPDGRLERHNLGGMHEIAIGGEQGVILLRFDLSTIPPEAIVKSAKLELYCISVGFSDEEIRREVELTLTEFNTPWIEGSGDNLAVKPNGATAKTSDGRKQWPEGSVLKNAKNKLGATLHRDGEQKWYSWEVPPQMVKEWIDLKRPNYGVMLAGGAPGKSISFASSETTTVLNRPKLMLTLSFPGPSKQAKQAADETRRNLERIPRVIAAEARYVKAKNKTPSGLGFVGDSLRIGDLEWKVASAKNLGETLKSGNQFIKELKTEGRFVEVEFHVNNQGSKPLRMIANHLIDDSGRQFEHKIEADWFVPEDKRLNLIKLLNPGLPHTCRLIYEVPDDATGLSFLVSNGVLLRSLEGVIDLGSP